MKKKFWEEIIEFSKKRIEKCNENIKESEYDSIIFMNTPISTENEDIIGINTAVDSIKKAVDNDAKMIGVLADYGSGKSSLTETLAKDEKSFGKSIHINMWDSISKLDSSQTTTDTINALTKSFVFQLASGISEHCAKYANRRLSKNYSIFSFSISSWNFWVWAIFAALSYIIFAALSLLKITDIKSALEPFSQIFTPDYIYTIAVGIKASAPIFMVLGIVLAIIGLRKTTVAFSHWKSEQNREPEINDIFEAYLFIHKKLLRLCHHKLIIVEDLDRIKDKELVVGFLKEIYRFTTLPQKRWRKSPTFIISIMNESHLEVQQPTSNAAVTNITTSNATVSHTTTSNTTTTNTKLFINDNVYSKLFDYTISLRPIHFEDYAALLLAIIGDENSINRVSLQNLLEDNDKIKNNTIPKSFDWIIKGHNLTIRQLKDRLNSAVSLLVTLKNKGYKNQSYINFSSCSAVAYLEHQYPELFGLLLKQEEALSNLVRVAYTIKSNNSNPHQKIEEKCNEIFSKSELNSISSFNEMKKDIVKMLELGDISDDFRMYFYSFPKNSYIKNADERDIANLLLLPNEYTQDDELDNKIAKIKLLDKTSTIVDTLIRISNDSEISYFPKIIFDNEFLFSKSYEINSKKVLNAIYHFASWKEEQIDNSKHILEKLISYSTIVDKKLWDTYAKWLAKRFISLESETRIKIRKYIISIVGDYIKIFKNLYITEPNQIDFILGTAPNFTLITEDELASIQTDEIGTMLINIDLITEENVKYIAEYINKNSSDDNCSVFDKKKEIYKHISQKLPPEKCWRYVIQFLKINQYVDDELFQFTISGISKSKEEKEIIADYLCSLSSEKLSDKYLELIDNHIIDVNLSETIVNCLLNKKLFSALLSFFVNEERLNSIDFIDMDNKQGIKNALVTLLSYNESLIPIIRKNLIIQFVNNNISSQINDYYGDVFYEDYPRITKDEMELLPKLIDSLTLLNRSKITTDNFEEIVYVINKKYDQSDCLKIFELLLNTEYADSYSNEAIVVNIINSLDYRKIRFVSLTNDEKKDILAYVKKYQNLSNFANAKSFMETTMCLFPELEKIVLGAKKDYYVELINKIDAPSDFTMEWVEGTPITFGLPQNILQKLLDKELYSKYLIGKVLKESSFYFPYQNVPNEVIISEYSPKSPIWNHLITSLRFINHIIQNKIYEGFNKTDYINLLRPLYQGKQTVEFTKFVLDNVPSAEQLKYLREMGEIFDDANRVKISQLLLQEPYIKLLSNDETFNTVKACLWDTASSNCKGYKSAFSRKRKEYLRK